MEESSEREIDRLREEVSRLSAEQAALEARLSGATAVVTGGQPHRNLRRSITAVLAGLGCVLILASMVTVWVRQTVVRTDGFVSTMAPIVESAAVTEVLSVDITNQVFNVVDLEGRVGSLLPAQGKFLTVPVSSAARNFVQSQVLRTLRSKQIRPLLVTLLRIAHTETIAAIRGQSQYLTVDDGMLVLNTLSLVDVALQQLQSAAPGILGNVTIPSVSAGELPAQIRSALSGALNIELPEDFGKIEIGQAATVRLANNAVTLDELLSWVLPAAALVCIAGTIYTSRERRRTILQLLAGTAIAMIVGERAVAWVQDRVVDSVDAPHREASRDVVHLLLHGLVDVTWAVFAIALVVAAFVLVTGPYHWAVQVRSFVGRGSDGIIQALSIGGSHRPAGALITKHYRPMQVGGLVVGGLLLWLVPGWWFFAIAGILILYQLVLWRAGPRSGLYGWGSEPEALSGDTDPARRPQSG